MEMASRVIRWKEMATYLIKLLYELQLLFRNKSHEDGLEQKEGNCNLPQTKQKKDGSQVDSKKLKRWVP